LGEDRLRAREEGLLGASHSFNRITSKLLIGREVETEVMMRLLNLKMLCRLARSQEAGPPKM
jgi:hypothetical protein